MKLAIANKDRRSAKAGLRNVEVQTEQQRQRLYYTEIELATAKQQVLELKAELSKAKEAAQMAQAAANTAGQKFYDLRVQETEAWLTEELAGVYREYCLEVWTEALNMARALADSKWRKAENVFYPEDL